MKGHIRQRSKGSWEIAIDIGKDPSTGKRIQHFETIRGCNADAQRRVVLSRAIMLNLTDSRLLNFLRSGSKAM